MIYLDNAATTFKKPRAVTDRLCREARSGSANAGRASHAPALEAAEKIFEARKTAADYFGALPERTVFTPGCTDALNTVIFGAIPSGAHVLTTVYEHNAALRPLYERQRRGEISFSVLPAFPDGHLTDPRKYLRHNTAFVIVNAVSNVTGQKQDMAYWRSFCRLHGLALVTDAAQAAGKERMTVSENEYLCAAGHKGLYGMQGTGLLVMGPEASVPRPLRMGGTGSRSLEPFQPTDLPEYLEAGTQSTALIAALGAGIGYVRDHPAVRHEEALTKHLLEAKKLPGVTVYGSEPGGVVAMNIGDLDSAEAAAVLDREYGICCRGGFHCAPLVHRFLGTENRGAVRFSPDRFNTHREIEQVLAALKEMTK